MEKQEQLSQVIAIDDISISEVTSAPTANFSISNSLPCLNQTIDLIDNSLNSPSVALENNPEFRIFVHEWNRFNKSESPGGF